MPGIPVIIVERNGLPVVSVAQGRGITVTVAANGYGLPITIATNGYGLPVYIENDTPVDPAPVFSANPVISGTPQVGQTLSGTTGTASNTTSYARQWLRNGTAISGATGASYLLTNDDVGATITMRSTATGPGGTAQATSNALGPVTAATALWTPNDLPAEYKTNGGMWDAANSVIAGTNQVASVPDSWGVRDMVQATSGAQPFFGQRNGFPAVVWPDTTSNRFVAVANDFQPKYYIEVGQFQTGTEATADAGITHIVGGNGDTNGGRVRIRQGVGALNASDGAYSAARNGDEAWGPTILPLPMSILEIQGQFGSTPWGAGRASISGRSWRGPKWFWMFLGEVPTLDLRQRIQGWAAWKYGLQGSLPANHPYKNAAPTKELVVQQQGSNFAVNAPPSDQSLTVNQTGSEFALSGA